MLNRAFLVPLALTASMLASPQQPDLPENFTANAIVNTELRSGAGLVQIRVTRWSTDGERARFVKTLQAEGPEGLVRAFQEAPRVGNIRTPDSLGYPLHYAREIALPNGGRRIVLATDRPIGYWEALHKPRTIDYPFAVIQMEFAGEGRGKGTISYATKITVRDDAIELENFESAPIALSEIRSDRRR